MTAGWVRERPTGAPVGRAPRRRRRWPRRLLQLVGAAVVLGALLLAVGWARTPSVSDADALVTRHLAAHDAQPLQGQVPAKVAAALVATEDSRFADTPGVDPLGLIREPLGAVTGRDQGGATLEQQLVKNLYQGGSTAGLTAKAENVLLALKLDRSWTKDQILRMYLDDGYYGNGFYGLTAASEGYFGLAPAQLDWAQASLLAGLFQAPSAYNPLVHADAARARQAHVLDRLVATGRLTRAAADTIAAQDWGLRAG